MTDQELETLAKKIEAIPFGRNSFHIQFLLGCRAAAEFVRGQLSRNAGQLKDSTISGALNPPGKEQVTVSADAPVVRPPAG